MQEALLPLVPSALPGGPQEPPAGSPALPGRSGMSGPPGREGTLLEALPAPATGANRRSGPVSALAWIAVGIFGVSLAVIVGVLVYAFLGTVCPAEEPVGRQEGNGQGEE